MVSILRVDSHLLEKGRAPFSRKYVRPCLAVSQHPITLDAISLADLSELVIDLSLEQSLGFWSLMVVETLFCLGCVFGSLLNDFLGDLELGDMAALACKVVAVAFSLRFLWVVVALEHLIAQINADS